MEQRKMEQQCLAYFRSHPVWQRLLTGFYEKYRSYGSFSGTVVLRRLTESDIEELEGFFSVSFHGKKSASISAARFTQALGRSRFGEISPEELLGLFVGGELIDKRTEQLQAQQKRANLEAQLREKYAGTYAGQLFPELLELADACRTKDDAQWARQLCLGAEILNGLPYRNRENVYLAVFATRITGDPHAFDQGSAQGRFLYQLIERELEARGLLPQKSELFPAFYRKKCFLQVGILLDDVSNYTICYGVRAKKPDGTYHAGIDGSLSEHEPAQLPLSVLAGLQTIECVDHRIFVVENPSVFAELCGDPSKRRSCMCMNGQPRLAGLVALELLAASGTQVYYAGDFDPEGLLIAQKLAQYYRETLHGSFCYWHLGLSDYEDSRSKKTISEKRLKMLDHITDQALLPAAQRMRECALAGYQEKLPWRSFFENDTE